MLFLEVPFEENNQECSLFSEKNRGVSFWFKIKSAFVHGISDWNFHKNSLAMIITLLQTLFYRAYRKKLTDEIASLTKYLSIQDAKGK